MDAINDFFTAFSSFLWGWPMIILLLGTHIFLTIRLRFPQRKIFKAIKLSVKKDKNATGDVSQFGALATFAFSTTLGWSYYGERCVEYLKGKKWMLCFRIVYIATIFLGSVISLGLVWNIADCMNALMAIPNLISLLCLSGIIVHETRKYLWRDQLDKDMDEKEIEELE
jgi:Na+/alanine symporter